MTQSTQGMVSGREAQANFSVTAAAQLFSRPKQSSATAAANVPSSKVSAAVEKGNELIVQYTAYKSEFMDRSDRGLWQLLGNVYDYVLEINKDGKKREIKKELLDLIKIRDKYSMPTSSETEALVVRYIFADQARQTRNNYVVAIEKARAQDIPVGGMYAFLERHKGVVNVVEMDFDDNSGKASADKLELKTQREESIKWVRRLFAAMSHCGAKAPLTNALVADWNPTAEELANVKSADKDAAKYQRGNFVFFVALPDAKAGTYNVVQGFEASRDFEDQLLLQISNRMGANINDLKDAVNELENSLNLTQQSTAQPESENA